MTALQLARLAIAIFVILDAGYAQIADSSVRSLKLIAIGLGTLFIKSAQRKKKRWSHKRIYRMCCDLELNLKIKPKKHSERETPSLLAVPAAKK